MSAFDRLVALKQRGSLIESALSVYLMDRVPSYLPGLPSTRKKAVPSSLLRKEIQVLTSAKDLLRAACAKSPTTFSMATAQAPWE